MHRLRTSFTVLLLLAALGGCIEEQSHGPRGDAGAMTDADAPRADTGVDGGSVDTDAGNVDGGTAADGGTEALPAILDIVVASTGRVEVELIGSTLVPTLVDNRYIQVQALASEGSQTFVPTGTVGPCDLYPAVGTTTWPPSTGEPPTALPLPPGAVTVTADGAPLTVEVAGTLAMARSQHPDGTTIAVEVRWPGHAPIRREVVLGAALSVSSPANAPSVSEAMLGGMDPASGLRVEWPVVHDAGARQSVDVTGGSRGAARCIVNHGDGDVELSAGELSSALIDGSEPSLVINMHASVADETTVETTLVRLRESWSSPSVILSFPD